MAFNPDKCEVIRITNKKKTTLFNYTLHGVGLKETDSAKYLGVNISRDLSWAKHINQITMKTNNSLKFIKRNIQTNNPKLKESAYKTYVHPLVEYAASVWDPWQKKYINKIEMIQHRAIMVPLWWFRLKDLSIDEMVGAWCFGCLSGPPGFTCWISFAPVFSLIYCWVLILALSPCYILIYMF